MKPTSQSPQSIPSTKPANTGNKGGKQPDVRDDLDSRKNEEQEFKGDDVTHNEKETQEKK
jgi:hypothetical protein